MAIGQCVESYGTGDPYLPLLDALERLARGAGGEAIRHALRRHAPAWLAQMPSLVGLDEREALVHAHGAPTPQGMLRELAGLVEALTSDQELVFWLEDLHWADHPTLLAIAFLARRREPARLLLIGSYRPTELLGPDHPLTRVKRDLLLHRQAEEVALGPLAESAIAEYLAARLGEGPVSPDLTRHVHARTEGNPLFMVTAVDDLLARGAIRQTDGTWALTGRLTLVVDVPSTVRELIEQQLERLGPEDRQLLEVASAVGVEFAASAVAAGLDQDLERTEARCAELARQGRFIRGRGEVVWPDGTTASRFAFVHAVHQQVLYERIPAERRRVCHSRIGARLEAAYGAAAREIAAELATHSERARDASRAVRYFRLAGENALGRAAHAEAIAHLSRALSLLEGLPAGRRRVQSELELLVTLGPAWIVARGYAAVEVEQTYQRALTLCRQLARPPELFRALQGLWNVRLVRGDLTGARALAGEILERARRSRDARLLARAHAARGETCFHLGQLEAARQPSGPRPHPRPPPRPHGTAPAGSSRGRLCELGPLDGRLPRSRPGARRAGPGPGLRPRASAQPRVRPGLHRLARAVLRRGRAGRRAGGRGAGTLPGARHPVLAQLGRDARRLGADPPGTGAAGLVQMAEGLAAYRATGAEVGVAHFLVALAEAHGAAGDAEAGLRLTEEALALSRRNGNRYFEPEAWRVRGEILWQVARERGPAPAEPALRTPVGHGSAVACLRRAHELARRRGARAFELRAATALARAWQADGRARAARRLLAPLVRRFREGADTLDLQTARAVLDGVSASG